MLAAFARTLKETTRALPVVVDNDLRPLETTRFETRSADNVRATAATEERAARCFQRGMADVATRAAIGHEPERGNGL
jgi:hypothetical protein